jgi:two-component system KDP operon response regulator KdpE
MSSRIAHSEAASGEAGRPSGRLLIVEDDHAVRRALHLTLFEQGFDISEAGNAEEALALAGVIRLDAVLLDINLPGKDGVQVCRELRRSFPRLAILVVSVRSEEEERVEALDAGADDYIVKPFGMRELTARIRAAVRRVQASSSEIDNVIVVGEIQLYPVRRLVRRRGQPIHLTPKEFDLLLYLMRHPGIPVSHGRLLCSIWGPEHASQVEYLRTFIRQLRGKLEDNPAEPKYILTDNHVGYRFTDGSLLG